MAKITSIENTITKAKNHKFIGAKNATTLAKVVIPIMPKIMVKLNERFAFNSLLNTNPWV
ncbi:MAG: hypothetical protein ACEQSR_08680 [Candidatus Methylacidiphilales bacterium]